MESKIQNIMIWPLFREIFGQRFRVIPFFLWGPKLIEWIYFFCKAANKKGSEFQELGVMQYVLTTIFFLFFNKFSLLKE